MFRIIMMLLIVGHHFVVHGGKFPESPAFSPRSLFIDTLAMGGKVGVNGFVLITGYYLCTGSFKWTKLVRIVLQVLTYSVVILGAFLIYLPAAIPTGFSLRAAFPLSYSVWWFATVYVLLYTCSPVLNVLIRNLDKQSHLRVVLVGGILFCIIPTLVNDEVEATNLVWFCYLYVLAAYLRLHPPQVLQRRLLAFMLGCAAYLLPVIIYQLYQVAGPLDEPWSSFFRPDLMAQQRLPTAVAAVALFAAFLNVKLRFPALIQIVASASFGVYLFHDHPLVRKLVWGSVVRPAEHANMGAGFYVYALGSILAVYAAGVLVDIIRQFTIEPPILAVSRSISRRWSARGDKVQARS